MKQDHRVVRWYPWQMYERYRAVESIAYEFRRNQNKKTRVKVGRDDIELSIREAGSSVWKKQALPANLPRFEMVEQEHRPAMASSPPPGRPGRSQMFGESGGQAVSEEVVLEDNVAIEAAEAKQ